MGAVLGTVQVACAVERGLEALVLAFNLVAHGEGERGLMEACLSKPKEVGLEIQKAIVGMSSVLKANVQKVKSV